MSAFAKRIAWYVLYAVVAVSCSGVVVALLGMVIGHETVYYTGLVMALSAVRHGVARLHTLDRRDVCRHGRAGGALGMGSPARGAGG